MSVLMHGELVRLARLMRYTKIIISLKVSKTMLSK